VKRSLQLQSPLGRTPVANDDSAAAIEKAEH
jgi:hypothetical protein